MRHWAYVIATTSLLILLGGCNQSPSPAPTSGETAQMSAPAEEPIKHPPAADQLFYLTPARLDACEPGAIVVVHWDVRATHPEITDVEIWTGSPGNQTLFAAGGYAGEASTEQPWGRPGTVFSLRNKDDGKEVATATVDGPSCAR